MTTGSTMRILEPAPGILAFYDGRIPGLRLHGPEANWLDDGAFSLGAASYAVVSGRHALVYDTHITIGHAEIVRQTLAARGVTDLVVVLSHWHRDHIAGNAVFEDCEIVALAETAALLEAHRETIETGNPPIAPLVMPNRIIEGAATVVVGDQQLELLPFDIHSRDGLAIWRPADALLLAGDTLEDTVTYVAEPGRLAAHRSELDRMARLPIRRILPNHGDPDRIAAGGYAPSLIDATRRYTARLDRLADDPGLAALSLASFAREDIETGAVIYIEAYEDVHRANVEAVRAVRGSTA